MGGYTEYMYNFSEEFLWIMGLECFLGSLEIFERDESEVCNEYEVHTYEYHT